MALVQFFKVTTLPGVLEPDSIYYVQLSGGLHADTFITDSYGNAKSAGVALIDARIDEALEGLSIATAEVVADLTARDTYIATLTVNKLVLVCDASDDPEVGSGSALYIYEHDNALEAGGGTIHRVPGFNGVNVTLAWDAISGRPVSTPSQIDAAVTASHNHSNAAVLNKLGEDSSGELTYDGQPIQGTGGAPQWDTADW